MDLSSKTDRELLEGIYRGLFDKQSPFDRDDDAPEQVREGVEGFERVFGPKPKQGTDEYREWRKQILRTTKVYAAIPDEYEAAAMELAARTGRKAVFVEHDGELKVSIDPKPKPWFIAPITLKESVEGVIRSVLGE